MANFNSAFLRRPEEGALVGRIVVQFGELEVAFCHHTASALDAFTPLMKALYSLKSTSSRIDFLDGLIRGLYIQFELGKEYDTSISMLRYCLRIRNLYAHCNWGSDVGDYPGMFYADFQDSAKTDDFRSDWRHVDTVLLQKQEDYFAETMSWLLFLYGEVAVKKKRITSHAWPRPSELEKPHLHNPASQHIPPWLTEDQKARHLGLALEDEAPPQQPVRPRSVLRLTKEEWAAKEAQESAAAGKPDQGSS